MPRFAFRRTFSKSLAPLAGLALVAGVLYGCAGDLDPGLMGSPPSGTGGMTGSTGGTTGTGGGGSVNCTGDNDPMTMFASKCSAVCHSATTASVIGGGLDLTFDSNIKSRLVGVKSPSTSVGTSKCNGNQTPYLNANSKPATGLLIDKIHQSPPACGDRMPSGGPYLSADQEQCVIQWATTLTSP